MSDWDFDHLHDEFASGADHFDGTDQSTVMDHAQLDGHDFGAHGGYDLMGADPDEENLWDQLMLDMHHDEANPFAAT